MDHLDSEITRDTQRAMASVRHLPKGRAMILDMIEDMREVLHILDTHTHDQLQESGFVPEWMSPGEVSEIKQRLAYMIEQGEPLEERT